MSSSSRISESRGLGGGVWIGLSSVKEFQDSLLKIKMEFQEFQDQDGGEDDGVHDEFDEDDNPYFPQGVSIPRAERRAPP